MRMGLLQRRLSLLMLVATVACKTVTSDDSLRVPVHYWLASPGDEVSVADAFSRLHTAVTQSLSGGILEPGYPRACAVTGRPPPTGPFYPECLEDGAPHDGLQLAPSGLFLQFVTLDFPSPRLFLFEVYLVPDSRVAESASFEELSQYPRIAIPSFGPLEPNYEQVLTAIARGFRTAGASTLER